MIHRETRDPRDLHAWFSIYRKQPAAEFRLYCLPFAGGGASPYRNWAMELPPDVEVVALRLPGRESRICEPPVDNLQHLIQNITEALQVLLPSKPIALFGHSFGAVLALELGRELVRVKLPLLHVFVAGRTAPHLPIRESPVSASTIEEIQTWLRRLAGTPDEALTNRELLRLAAPALQADLAMNSSYRSIAEPPLPCPLTALGAREDSEVTSQELRAWSSYTSNSFAHHQVEGNHFFPFNDSRRVTQAILIEALRASATSR